MMVQKNRKAAADFEVVPLIPGEDKPSPPEDLPDVQKEVWRSIVDAMPLRWFGRETWPILRALCRHQIAAEVLGVELGEAIANLAAARTQAQRISRRETVAELQVMHARETGAVRRCSADLRLTRHSRVRVGSAESAIKNQTLKRPWDD
jgi:hypothetical protein